MPQEQSYQLPYFFKSKMKFPPIRCGEKSPSSWVSVQGEGQVAVVALTPAPPSPPTATSATSLAPVSPTLHRNSGFSYNLGSGPELPPPLQLLLYGQAGARATMCFVRQTTARPEVELEPQQRVSNAGLGTGRVRCQGVQTL